MYFFITPGKLHIALLSRFRMISMFVFSDLARAGGCLGQESRQNKHGGRARSGSQLDVL